MYKNDPQKDMERDIKHQIRILGYVSAPYLMRKYKLSAEKANEISKKKEPAQDMV